MKYMTLLLMTIFSLQVQAQITLEHSYANAGHNAVDATWQQLYIVNLESEGAKYLYANKAGKKLRFYNLDHTLWKTIDFSQATDMNPNANSQNITYISQYIFDLDDEIEFLYVDYQSPTLEFITQVINEDGTVIFSVSGQAPLMNPSAPQDQLPIRNTPNGTKLILSDDGSGNGEAHVYGLPGTLSVGVESNVTEQMMFGASLRAYPNPSTGNIQIEYDLPFGKQAKLQVSDELGRSVQTVQLAGHEGTYTLNAAGLGTGVYFCSLLSGTEVLATEKLSVIRNEQ